MNLLQKFEKKVIDSIQEERLSQSNATGINSLKEIHVGDTLTVGLRVLDTNNKVRTQLYGGVCIAKSNKGLRSSFTVRKIGVGNEGIDQKFLYYLSGIQYIERTRRGAVRRAKIYYIKKLTGKAAKVKEKYYSPKKDD